MGIRIEHKTNRYFFSVSLLTTFFFIVLANASLPVHATASLADPQGPQQIIDSRLQKILVYDKSRPLFAFLHSGEIRAVNSAPSKVSWLDAVYRNKLVEASWTTKMLADKRILFELISRSSGGKATAFYPKTVGLREFLISNHLLDANGKIAVSGEILEEKLLETFPTGFVVRPAVGVAANETSRGIFPDSGVFIAEILRPANIYYSPEHAKRAIRSKILAEVASGEAVVLQEDVIGTADAHRILKSRFFNQIRVHTYEGQVVEGAIPNRWIQKGHIKASEISAAENYVRGFLKTLPATVLNRQAWGVDVAVFDNGDLRVIDLVCNRGMKIQWSSYLEQPAVLAAYTKHFEKLGALRFTGFSGVILRDGFANYWPYWQKRIEKAHSGSEGWLAYFPPLP
jgi:hypothetical protein